MYFRPFLCHSNNRMNLWVCMITLFFPEFNVLFNKGISQKGQGNSKSDRIT
jgi:hypothetical protein